MPVRVLIVEDVSGDADLVAGALRRGGLSFEHRVVATEVAYLDSLEAFDPDIVLSDYNLPGFGGLEALRLLLAQRPHVPFIVVTGSVNEETAAECIKRGAADYVIKEHLGRLVTAVRSALEHARLQTEAEGARERRDTASASDDAT